MVTRQAHNLEIVGSSPTPATIEFLLFDILGIDNQVERLKNWSGGEIGDDIWVKQFNTRRETHTKPDNNQMKVRSTVTLIQVRVLSWLQMFILVKSWSYRFTNRVNSINISQVAELVRRRDYLK